MKNISEQMEEINRQFLNSEISDFKKKLSLTGQIAKDTAKKTFVSNKNYYKRDLLNSITYNVKNTGFVLSLEFGSNNNHAAGNEFGGGRGFGYESALKWANEKKRLGHINIEENKIKTFAYFVSKKVQRDGRSAKPTIGPAFENAILKVFGNE